MNPSVGIAIFEGTTGVPLARVLALAAMNLREALLKY
jgi:hypothetical protein